MTKKELTDSIALRIALADRRGDWRGVELYVAAFWDAHESDDLERATRDLAGLDARLPLCDRLVIGEAV